MIQIGEMQSFQWNHLLLYYKTCALVNNLQSNSFVHSRFWVKYIEKCEDYYSIGKVDLLNKHYQLILKYLVQNTCMALFKLTDTTLYWRPSHVYDKHCKVWRVIKGQVLHDIPHNVNLGRNSIYYFDNLHICAMY